MNRIFSVFALVISVTALVLCSVGFFGGKEHAAFFNADKVYKEYEMKKELEAKMQKMSEYQTFMIDSLKFKIRSVEQKAMSNPKDQSIQDQLGLLYEQFNLTAREFKERNDGVSSQYNKMVLDQIRQKAKEFRMKKNLPYFIGQGENTDLVFYDDAHDLSDEFILFLNESYSGGKITP
ncbi:MAG: hypothetical protein GC180_12835 [Bacteroidetes bacterium]|nr:hypothetical protein [Bacteroidota bacterium]